MTRLVNEGRRGWEAVAVSELTDYNAMHLCKTCESVLVLS